MIRQTASALAVNPAFPRASTTARTTRPAPITSLAITNNSAFVGGLILAALVFAQAGLAMWLVKHQMVKAYVPAWNAFCGFYVVLIAFAMRRGKGWARGMFSLMAAGLGHTLYQAFARTGATSGGGWLIAAGAALLLAVGLVLFVGRREFVKSRDTAIDGFGQLLSVAVVVVSVLIALKQSR